MAKSGWQEAGWSSARLHAIYDLARWTREWAKFTDDLIQYVCPGLHRMCLSVPGHAVWINYTLLKVARTRACFERMVWEPLLRLVSSAANKKKLTRSWTTSQITDPPTSWGKVSAAHLMNLDKPPLSLFYYLIWVNQAVQEIILPTDI